MQAGRETDGSRCEGDSRVLTGEELCFRSPLPEIYVSIIQIELEEKEGERGEQCENMELCIAGVVGGGVSKRLESQL